MILRRLHLRDFRNYISLELDLSEHSNFFAGKNAQGKSNLLEAIHTLAMTRSFRSSNERDLMRLGGERYEITGEFIDKLGIRHYATICNDTAAGKESNIDRKRLTSRQWVGRFPVVLFSPESHKITSGPPVERRRFVDMLLCQSSPAYLADLIEYNRVLRHRNTLLGLAATANADFTVWSQALAAVGCRVMAARFQLIDEYAQSLHQAYAQIAGSPSPFRVSYRTRFESTQTTPERFLQRLQDARQHEERRKRTLLGPHVDDFEFAIGGKDVRQYGSRGEQKTALMALKWAEAGYLKAKTGSAPMILLDDLPSELDAGRLRHAIDCFADIGQLFITSVYPLDLQMNAGYHFEVAEGDVRRVHEGVCPQGFQSAH
jgi:DNA replication and repair protein RecF